MDKIKRYGWKLSGEKPILKYIPVSEIEIDHDYQRQEQSSKSLEISSDFNWASFGVILVAKYKDKYYAFDGQHRLSAAKSRGDIEQVPCAIYTGLDKPSQAMAFVGSNTLRKTMSMIDKYRALLVAGDKDALFLRDIANELGLSVSSNQKRHNLKCIGYALRITKRSPEKLKEILCLSDMICSEETGLVDEVVQGVDYIYRNMKSIDDLDVFKRRILTKSFMEIKSFIAAAKAFYVKGHAGVFAVGLINCSNKNVAEKNRLRIEVP